MSNSLYKITFSVLLTITVSMLFGLLFKNNFWTVFTLCTILQFIIFYTFNKIYTNRLIRNFEEIKIQQFKEANRNYLNVVCPCNDKNIQFIDIRFDADTIYKCNKCEKEVRCIPEVKTFAITSPIYFNK